MKMTLKQGIAVMIGVAGVGIVGAQVVEYVEPAPPVESAADMTSEPVDLTAPLVVDAPAPEAVAEPTPMVAAPEPIIVAQAPAPVLTAPVLIELPRSVSSRSGEGSLEEIAVRTAPVDERAGISPMYQVDQSPGL